MTLTSFSRIMLIPLGLGLAALPIVPTAAFARPARSLELVHPPYWADYGRDTSSYDS